MKITRRQITTCLLALLVVVAGAVAGFSISVPQPQIEPRNLASPSHGLGDLWTIASRNLRIGLQLLLGFVTLGIYGLIQFFGIGFALGTVLGSAIKSGMPGLRIALLLGPHTLIEFAGFILLGAIEFEAAIIAYHKLRYDQMPAGGVFPRGLMNQILAGFALIIIAALIEVYVTGTIAGRIGWARP